LDAPTLQKLKDETNLSNVGLAKWMKVLKGLTCSENELRKHFKEQKELFHKVLLPTPTPDGYVIHLDRLRFLMEAAYPWVLGDEENLNVGINTDATVMANRKTTAASLRFLHPALEINGQKVNSCEQENYFALFYGGDEKYYLSENVFRNGQPGKNERYSVKVRPLNQCFSLCLCLSHDSQGPLEPTSMSTQHERFSFSMLAPPMKFLD